MDFYSYSNIGGRIVNEDACGMSQFGNQFCFVVADGLGGHGGGDIASRCAVDSVCELFINEGVSEDFFRKAFENAQKNLLAAQKKSSSWDRMKTTLVVVIMTDKLVYYAHVGDSRFYHFKNGRCRKRSLDHSVPQMLVLSKDIPESAIRNHPDRNKLMRVMGAENDPPEYEEGRKIKLYGENAFLLCTDGFWELIDEEEMEKCLRVSSSAEEWVHKMCDKICMNGADREMDNYTCIAIISNRNWFGAEV